VEPPDPCQDPQRRKKPLKRLGSGVSCYRKSQGREFGVGFKSYISEKKEDRGVLCDLKEGCGATALRAKERGQVPPGGKVSAARGGKKSPVIMNMQVPG